MLTAIISDIHGNILALRKVLEDIASRGITDIICLGDVVGYGPRPGECIDLVGEKGIHTLCGNHDEDMEKLLSKVQDPAKKIEKFGNSHKSSKKALDRQIELMFTKNPRAFLSGSHIERAQAEGRLEYPSGMPEELHRSYLERKAAAWENLTFLEWLKVKVSPSARERFCDSLHEVHSRTGEMGVVLRNQHKLYGMNKELSKQVAEFERANARLAFLENLGGEKPKSYMIHRSMHCFHSSWKGAEGHPYLFDPNQLEIYRDDPNLNPGDYIPFKEAVDVAKNLGVKKVIIAKGHTHVPSIFRDTVDGIEIILLDPGTVGMPRIEKLEGENGQETTYYDKATYIVTDCQDRFDIVAVEYDWRSVYDDMGARGLPLNTNVWDLVLHPEKYQKDDNPGKEVSANA